MTININDEKNEKEPLMQEDQDNNESLRRRESNALTGSLLRQKRIEKGLSTKAVAKALCIRLVYIEAIENSDYKILPGEAYALGFIKTYANFLKLPAEETLAKYKKEIINSVAQNIPRKELEDLGIGTMMPKIGFLIVSMIVAIVVYFAWYASTIKQESSIEQVVEKTEAEAMTVPEEAKAEVSDLADTLLLESLEKVDLQDVLSENTPKKDDIKKTVVKESVKKEVRITLKSVEDSWMKISKDREVLFSGMLKKNDSYEIPAVSDGEVIILDTGNAGGIEIYVDKKLISKAGNLGEVKRGIVLDASSLVSKKGL